MTTPFATMEHIPLRTIDDQFVIERNCSVCGESTLRVVHVENLPDYVKCGNCESAFILSEAGDWAMYGAVSPDYPETKQTVEKRWTTLEAVRAMASSEQRPQPTAEAPESISEVTPPFGLGGDGAGTEGEERPTTPPFGFGELDDFVAESANGDSEPLPGVSEPLEETADIAEPEAGQRYIVTLSQKTATFPRERCAHCLRRPAPRNLLVGQAASSDPPYEVPLCESCHEQASMRTEEQQTSRLVAHLSSVLIAGLLIVGAMVVGLIDVREIGVLDLLLIATLALVGYGLPAVLLLGRTSQLPPSEDAKFVRSTLRIRQNDGIAFGWRNRGYAELFSADNEEILLGELARALED